MSVTEAQTGHSLVKKMLRRKLTSSKCLFLGESGMQSGNRRVEVCRHSGSNCTCSVTEVSVQSCDEVAGASPTERRSRSLSMNPEAHQQDRNQFIQKLNAFKQVFSMSVNCFKSLRPGEGGSLDEEECHAVTILNRHTRGSLDLNTAGGITATEMHQFNNAAHVLYVEEKEAIKSKAFKLLSQLSFGPKLLSKAKSSNSLRLKAFWRQKQKKASYFFQECIRETQEYTAEEGVIILVNEHADERMTPEVKRHCPETLTVSVDVTAVTSEIEGTSEDSEASKTSSHVSNYMKVVAGVSVISSGEIHMIPQSSEDSWVTQNSTGNQDRDHSQNVNNLHEQQSPPRVISKGTASGDEIRLYAAFNSDSFSVCHDAAVEHGPVGNKVTASTVIDDVAVVHLDASDGYVMVAHYEPDAEQQWQQQREVFLLETACSVVEVAIKMALKQFKDEPQGTSAHLEPYNWH